MLRSRWWNSASGVMLLSPHFAAKNCRGFLLLFFLRSPTRQSRCTTPRGLNRTEFFDPFELILRNRRRIRISKIVEAETIGFARRERRDTGDHGDAESDRADLQWNIG